MILTEEEINSYLSQEYDKLLKRYGNQCFGLFIVGQGNYGFAESLKEITLVCIYIPTLTELCTTNTFDSNKFETENNLFIIDIRSLYNAAKHCKWGALELLYTNYYIINTPYQDSFVKNFLNHREKISTYNKEKRITICANRAEKAIANHRYYEAERLRIASNIYLYSGNCEEAFHLNKNYQINYLQSLKNCKEPPTDEDIEEIFNDFEKMIDDAKKCGNGNLIEADNLIKNGIVDIIIISLQKKISIEEFSSKLTKTENNALAAILARLNEHGEGNISISAIVEETGISRPVYKNLFTKLEKNNIAKINNQGVKGTYISFDMSIFN